MRVCVIIPTRNEAGAIGRVIEKIPKRLVNEIVVIDGNSQDNTAREVKANLRKADKFFVQKGLGFGSAILEGVKKCSSEVIIIMDGDGSHDPKLIPTLVKKINAGYEYVLASRYIKGGKSHDDTLLRWFGNKLLTFLTNVVHGTEVTDSLYLFTAMNKIDFNTLNLKSTGFEFCIEILIKAHCAKLKFAEVAAFERKRLAGKSKVNALWHGFKILRMICKRY